MSLSPAISASFPRIVRVQLPVRDIRTHQIQRQPSSPSRSPLHRTAATAAAVAHPFGPSLKAMDSIKWITAKELARMILDDDKVRGEDYLVIDVRDDDFAGGNIVGCVHSPSTSFMANVDSLLEEHGDVKAVVFHCAFSQQRGPKAARIYQEMRDNLHEYKDLPQDVFVLRDGFGHFQSQYKDNPRLVEKWDRKRWTNWF